MQARFRSIVRVVAVTTALALSGCPATPQRPVGPDRPDAAAAARLAAVGRPADAAAAYAALADRSTGADAAALRLLAAEQWWIAGEQDRSRRQLARIDAQSLPSHPAARVQILAARLALDEGRAAEALLRLSMDARLLPPALAADALELRADAQLALGRAAAAVVDLVARERYLSRREAIAENQEAIWRAVRRLDAAEIDGADPVLDGWLALAELRHTAWQEPARFDALLRDWQARYPRHPAASVFVPRLVEEQRRIAGGVRQIALLLPLTGRFEAAAAAVRDGFVTAHYRTADPDRRPRVHVYDTGDDPANAPSAYRRAVEDGADFIVGPLQRESVAALAASGDLPVPVLALNAVDGERVPGLYQFGLIPEDEAEQIADRAALEGHVRAVALVPDNDLGVRMLRAFTDRFGEYGGEVIAAQLYDPQQRDHSAPIVRALAIDESRSRAATLRVVLNAPLQAEPRRRRDADFVFLIATPQQGRSLRPQLRFHHASDLPVFASSLLYAGTPNRAADGDLNGIAFTDMPWTVSPDPATRAVQQEVAATLGATLERNSRLFALGYDAYRLAPVLRHDPELLDEPVPAATGALRVDAHGRIHRTLAWAQFRGGLPRPLQAPVVPAADLADEDPTER